MSSCISVIVGLGNPGPQYSLTRHNVGFWFVDALAQQTGVSFRHEPKFLADIAKITFAGQDIWLVKPTTFMNRSGQAVSALLRFYKIPVDSILVVHDDLDLPAGTTRLKEGGGHGGHNGLRDMVAQLQTNQFARLRIGIGHPGKGPQVIDFVLGHANKTDQAAIISAIENAMAVLPQIVGGDMQKAMNTLHTV